MRLRLDWLNRPVIGLLAAATLGLTLAGRPTPGPTEGDDALTKYLTRQGWQDPPMPGDLDPVMSRVMTRAGHRPELAPRQEPGSSPPSETGSMRDHVRPESR